MDPDKTNESEACLFVHVVAQFLFLQIAVPVPNRGQVLVKVKACGLSIVSQAVSKHIHVGQ